MPGSYTVPSTEVPGYSAIYRHPKYKDGTQGDEFSEVTTLYEQFLFTVKNNPKKEFFGTRAYYPETGSFGKYEWLTTTDVAEIVDDLGAGLDSVFATHAPEPNETTGQQPIGIFSINRAEWLMTELAAFRSRRYSIGISDIAGVESAEYNINSADTRVVVCSIDKIPRILDRMQYTPRLKVVVSMDRLDCTKPTIATQSFSPKTVTALKAKAESLGTVLLDLDQVIQMGRSNPTKPTPPSPSDLSTICFTSGTSGAQKGAMITHSAFVNSTRGSYLSALPTNSTYLSYMSLVHIFDRFSIYQQMFDWVRVGFFSGDNTRILEDMQELRPTTVTLIPMILNRMYDNIASATLGAKGIKGWLSRKVFNSKLRRINNGKGFKHALWDRVLFSKVASIYGGRVQLMVSGATPLSPEVQNFFRVCLSCDVVQGYGQTETAGGGFIQDRGDISTGNIGIPAPGIDVRLRSIPEMSYNVTDSPCPRGEMMLRGGLTLKSYHNNPEKTAELTDGEWMATGDVVKVNTDGTFTILDRIGNIIKSASVMWVEPVTLELIYVTHKLVNFIYLYGFERAHQLVAIVVPNADVFVPWARRIDESPEATLEDLCKSKKVAEELTKELRHLAMMHRIPPPATIGAVHLEPATLDQVNRDMYTSTMKIRRHMVNHHYKSTFDEMYSTLDCITDPNFSAK
ncbi:medium-chain fatty acid-CoA ligase faa2 [Coemansia sp. RSA 1721]|nr:medium-chain fatty acid-CoA ligase faa2 [Coemansia sp. RSA 1721]